MNCQKCGHGLSDHFGLCGYCRASGCTCAAFEPADSPILLRQRYVKIADEMTREIEAEEMTLP